MTVAELIAALETFPDDWRVVVEGLEEGFDDCAYPETIKIELDVNPIEEGDLGRHADPRTPPVNQVVTAILIGRAGMA